jgi:hypothetical protein
MVTGIFWESVFPHACWFHASDNDDDEKTVSGAMRAILIDLACAGLGWLDR